MEERLRELLRTADIPDALTPGLAEAHAAAKALHASLAEGSPGEADKQYAALAQSCVQCHAAHRN
jgi:cytochrome c556